MAFLLLKILLSTVVKSVNIVVPLFGPAFKYRTTVSFLFLTFEQKQYSEVIYL